NDKWCCDDPVPPDAPVWVAVEFNQAVSLTHFTVTSGNDTPGRDPTDWAIQGSNDGTSWTDIYRFVDTVTPWGDVRNQVVKFTLPFASQAYSHIRYIAWDTPATLHQLNEIEYFGSVGAPEPAIKKGLVAYWNFDGSNLEDSVGNFDGTAMGSEAIPFVNGQSGAYGKAIQLNGEDQYVEVTGGEPDDLAFAGGSVSVAGWFKVAAFDTDWQALVAKGEGSNWRVARRGAEGGIAYAGGLTDTPTGKDVNDGAWHHFVAISDHTGAEFGTAVYIDGVRDTIIEGSAALVANGLRARIGDNPGAPSREFEGALDEIAIWNRVLTQGEITDLSKNPLSVLLNAIPGDADKDGMPDDYEIQYGFDPNDPTDAAKDFDGDGVSNVDEFRAGTDPTDLTKPTIVSAATTADFTGIILTFSEDLDPATVVAGNFTITPALAVTGVSYSRKVVTLTTAAQTPGATAYTVAVAGVRDLSKNEVAAGTTATVYTHLLTKAGVLRIAYWTGIGGTAVTALWDDPRYPAEPTGVGTLFSFNSRDFFPTDALENYGAVIEGLITPTETGNYHFFIRSDDASQLEISTDATAANLAWVAEQTGCCNAFTEPDAGTTLTTEPIAMVAGRSYFIRMTYKEGGGGDYGQVAWRKEGVTTPAAGSLLPIPGSLLSSAVDLPIPADGVWTTRTPGTAARNVVPNPTVTIVHIDGKSAWTAANVSMKFDGQTVTPTFVKAGTQATITYAPAGLLASLSTHTVALTYPDPSGAPTTLEWSFEVTSYGGPVVDKVAARPGLVFGAAKQTADQGGRTGAAGDYGMDFPNGTGSINVLDASFVNPTAATDKMSVALWQKATVRAGSGFWFNSPSSNSSTRGFQAHIPWSDSTIYFDTAGCCVADTQRINLNIDAFPGYTGDATWWNSWHHFAFVKDGPEKRIYIDGTLFHNGGGDPLPSDFTNLIIGGGPGINDNRMAGTMDDFAVFGSALTDAQVTSLFNGTAPGSVTGSPNLLAWWDFNDAPVVNVKVFVTRSGNNVTVTSEPAALPAGWVLQLAPTATGPWTTQAGATTPVTVPIGAANAFLRAAKP
ncbi:MAG: LamG-like jellyroll fold domain-containing protein, partial [Limisphaerales bacterium]